MPIYIIAALQALLYLLSIPVNVALRLDGTKVGTGVALFDRRAAWRKALAHGSGSQRNKPGLREIWPILRRLRFERVELTGRVSMGDAAATALVCGGLNGLGNSLRGKTDSLRVEVRPVFSDEISVTLRGMVCARTGQIMLAAIRYLRGRINSWTSIRSRA